MCKCVRYAEKERCFFTDRYLLTDFHLKFTILNNVTRPITPAFQDRQKVLQIIFLVICSGFLPRSERLNQVPTVTLQCKITLTKVIRHTVKPVLSSLSKIDKTKILMTNGSIMVKSIAECSHWSILQYF